MRFLRFLILAASLAAFGSGCSTLIGNVRPLEEKSEAYGVVDLAKVDPDWARLESQNDSQSPKEATPTEVSDVAFQSKRTHSIISLNSACRESPSEQEKDLRAMTNLLFLGMTDVSFRNEENQTVQGTPALQTTIQGKLSGEEMMLRTVVLRRNSCIYDLVYMARPALFESQLPDFSHFIASLRLR